MSWHRRLRGVAGAKRNEAAKLRLAGAGGGGAALRWAGSNGEVVCDGLEHAMEKATQV